MKLRIKGNALRLRLSKTEISDLVHNGSCWDSCTLLNTSLYYGIESYDGTQLQAHMNDGKIRIDMPKSEIENWDTNDKVSIQSQHDSSLLILVEKDFKCLIERPHEKESDLYENPAAK